MSRPSYESYSGSPLRLRYQSRGANPALILAPLAGQASGACFRSIRSAIPTTQPCSTDPRYNAGAAYEISNGGTSWSAWSCRP